MVRKQVPSHKYPTHVFVLIQFGREHPVVVAMEKLDQASFESIDSGDQEGRAHHDGPTSDNDATLGSRLEW